MRGESSVEPTQFHNCCEKGSSSRLRLRRCVPAFLPSSYAYPEKGLLAAIICVICRYGRLAPLAYPRECVHIWWYAAVLHVAALTFVRQFRSPSQSSPRSSDGLMQCLYSRSSPPLKGNSTVLYRHEPVIS